MRGISPRLTRILEILLQTDAPVSVDKLSEDLGSSRRTLFRELKNADKILKPYGLSLTSVPGKGLCLSGAAGERLRLLPVLQKDDLLPGNRRERLLGLLLDLLDSFDVHKLLYFSDPLGVSEATVSNDLDTLEPWLKERSITLVRKPGQGVCIGGTEEAIRRAILQSLMQDGNMGELPYLKSYDYPPADVAWGTGELFDRSLNRALAWMTPDSRDMLRLFLMVGIERIQKGSILPGLPGADGRVPDNSYLYRLSEFIAGKIEARFSLVLPPQERAAIAEQIKSCRSMLNNPFDPMEAKDYAVIQTLVYEMIERFDPELAPSLKINENLINGLSLHLWAALNRLEKQIELPNTLHDQVAEKYPELYEKTKQAVTALEEHLHTAVPSTEVSLIAVHFYAVLFNIEARNIRKRTLRVCVVCVAGIGVSYMLSSQIRRRYRDDIEIDLGDCSDITSLESYDLLISTIPLERMEKINKPVIVVNSFLTSEDHRRIREAIDKYAFVKRTVYTLSARLTLTDRLKRVTELLELVRVLFSNFAVFPIKPDCGFEELVKISASHFGADRESAALIYQALVDREAVSSQVIAPLEIVLLHARTAGISAPVLSLVMPEYGVFTQGYFQGAKCCLVMLLPARSPREMTEIMGIISSALVDSRNFLDTVHAGDTQKIRAILEAEVSEYLAQYSRETIKD
ncbi:MAG: PRD domain-containing protein [Treponema sp.]|jgi:transcriptional antiterminator|nr:PRD domain-containing protein [Treponema sp.]